MTPAILRGSFAVNLPSMFPTKHHHLMFVSERFGYSRNDIVVLTDDQQDPRSIPTKDNIVSVCAQRVLLPYLRSLGS